MIKTKHIHQRDEIINGKHSIADHIQMQTVAEFHTRTIDVDLLELQHIHKCIQPLTIHHTHTHTCRQPCNPLSTQAHMSQHTLPSSPRNTAKFCPIIDTAFTAFFGRSHDLITSYQPLGYGGGMFPTLRRR